MLQIHLLGQFNVRAAGKRLDLPSRAGQSLLAYLLLNAGTPQRRERLAGLLWPDTSDENARHNLRTELWRIRKALGSRDDTDHEYLLTEDLTITFNPEAQYWLDVNQLQRCTSADGSVDDLIGQLTLYQGELLPGFYDDWIVLERERLQAVFERDMKCLLEQLCAEQRWTTVLEWSERWIALGQTPEPAYRALMTAYAALGDRTKAIATFERCRTALAHDLGVEPSLETQNLYDYLRKDEGGGMRDEMLALLRLSATNVHPSAFIPHPLRQEEPPAPGEPPFKGLQYFDEADTDLFFGREVLTAKLIEHLHKSHFLAVIVGASGSGKSSIVRAGLIPALKRDQPQWLVHIITPTAHPLEALAVTLTRDSESITAAATLLDDLSHEPRSLALFSKRLLNAHHAPRLLLVIDQFEELFTLCHDEFEREAFIDNLLTATSPPPPTPSPSPDAAQERGRGHGGGGEVTLILTLRADFYAHLAQYPELREAVANQQEYIGPMTADELRRAIEEPAKRGGWEFEPGLVDLMLRDVGDEPGALPLLSHALLETWQRRSGHVMTLKGYADAGGVRGAIAYTAESVYQQLSADQQDLARHIFLELTELGEGTEDTRRRVKIEELITESDQVRPLLTTLADARLITTSEETVEVAHEALIREWPRLRDWLNEDREGLRLHRHLSEAAHDWELLEHDAGALYRGARLSQANEWAATNENSLSAAQRAFLAASNEQEQREAADREAQRQRELQAALTLAETQQQSATRLRRRNRVIIGAGMMALLLAGLAGLFGVQSNSNARQAESNLQNAQIAEARAVSEAQVRATAEAAAVNEAQARATAEAIAMEQKEEALQQASIGLAAQAVAELDGTAPERAVLLALEALENYPYTGQAESALAKAVENGPTYIDYESQMTTGSLYWNKGAWSPNGRWLAGASGGEKGSAVAIWDAATGERVALLQAAAPTNTVGCETFDLAWAPDNEQIVALYRAYLLDTCAEIQPPILWDMDRGAIIRSFDVYTNATSVDWSSDGQAIAIGDEQGTAKIWNASDGTLRWTLPGHTGRVNDVVFSPTGNRVATASEDGTAIIWEVASGQIITRLVNNASVTGVSWSPDGLRLGTSSKDGLGRVWDATTGTVLYTLPGHAGPVNDIVWTRDGKRIATVSDDGTFRIWNAETGTEITQVRAARVSTLALSPDGEQIATGGGSYESTYFRVWRILSDATQMLSKDGVYAQIRWSPDGRFIGASSVGASVWDAHTWQKLYHLDMGEDAYGYFDWSPDSRYMILSNGQNVRIWEPATGIFTDTPVTPAPNFAWATGWSADGSYVAAATYPDYKAVIQEVRTGKVIATVGDGICFMHAPNWSPRSNQFVTGCMFTSDPQDNSPATIWDAQGNKVRELPSSNGESVRADWSPDGTRIAVGYEDGTVKTWNAATGTEEIKLSAIDLQKKNENLT
jgi:WD40 repeat protein/DNA-binding SARP family transcriptional activator